MLSSEYFYNYFQLNHFDYKQEANCHLLEMDDKTFEATYKGIIDLNRNDYDRTIKMDIRFTFLLAVETLFEFIFALLPEEDGSLNDKKILQRLAEKNHYNAEIRKFAKEEPNRLDENFKKNFYYNLNGKLRSKPLIQQLFYAGVEQDRIEHDIKKCTDVIYRSLRVLAKEVANRTELNSYKHGFKAIPYFRTFEFQDPETKKNLIELDLRDSVSNFVFDEKRKTSRIETHTLDHERDILLTGWTSHLIANMVQTRKSLYKSGQGKEVKIMFFHEKEWERAQKANVKGQHFVINFDHKS